MYYSTANTLKAFRKSYIPNASGYVYSQTEYVNDGTGKVKRQAGVGSEFRMDGTGKQTRYFYGNATPAELIRLFGSNLGNANHYKKNLVVDANGQASVTYMDQEGRAVATALAGATPANVNPLISNVATGAVIVDVSSKNVKKDGSSTLVQKILNTGVNTTYTFAYNFSSLASTLTSFGCVSCKYDLKITITDPDGMLVLLPTIAGNQAPDLYSYQQKGVTLADCAVRATGVDISFPIIFTNLGDYTVTKTITPQELTFEEAKTIISQTASVQTKIQVLQNSYTVDASNCAVCTSCPEAEAEIATAMSEIVDRDCENMYQQIVQELLDLHPNNPDYIPSDTEIQAHAKYCQYQLCLSTKSTDLFEKQLARVTGWTDGVAKGYTALSTNPGLDPFFQAGALGNPSIASLQTKLGNVYIGTVAYDMPVNGVQDGTKDYKGTILQVVDPTNAAFFVDANGNATNSNTIGYHILYYDLMSRRAAMGTTAYQAELNVQRWTLYKSFYLEAKRKTKLEISNFQSCPEAKKQLEFAALLPTPEEEVRDYGIAHGAIAPMSDVEAEAIYHSFKLSCSNTVITPADQLIITNALKSYFNSKPSALLRVILTTDIGINPNLNAIQTILTKYGCATLITFAGVDPLSGATSKTVTYKNKFVPQTGGVAVAAFRVGASTIETTQTNLVSQSLPASDPSYIEMQKQQQKYMDEVRQKMLKEMMVKTQPVLTRSGTSSNVVSTLSAPLPSTAEYNALIAFYNSTGGPNWTNKTGWSTANPSVVQDVSGWFGVTVDATGHVTYLSLVNNNLVGSLPVEIGNLSFLLQLKLYANKLNGSIPASIGLLFNLDELLLSDNQLEGSIPIQMGSLSQLTNLTLGNNKLTGIIPPELGNLTNLKYLILAENQLISVIPLELGKLKNLQSFDLANNRLTGNIPRTLGDLSNLTELLLSSNQLTDIIPSELGKLSKLKSLWLFSNQLTGSIPTTLGNLPVLQSLLLINNRLTESIPTELGRLTKLDALWLAGNQLTGSIPSSLGELVNLGQMLLDHNQLSGEIPAELGKLANLNTLRLHQNGLSGSFPRSLSNLTKLKEVFLSNNLFDGNVSYPFSGSAGSLDYFQMATNKFTFDDFILLRQKFLGISFTFSPQDYIDTEKTLQVTLGNTRTLTTNIDRNTTPPSVYQWFKYVNGTSDEALNSASTTGHTLLLPAATAGDHGKKYYYKITNPSAAGLTLVSRMQTIDTVSDSTRTINVCTDFDATNTTIAKWTFKVDAAEWARVVQRCIDNATAENLVLIEYATDKLIEEEATDFFIQQRTNCLGNLNEKLTFSFDSREHQYTLYYYDQAGNLVQTVAPEGVKPLSTTQITSFLAGTRTEPSHNFVTRYQSNSLNQSIWQQTPDAGQSLFYYNNKGQLKLSQNAQQAKDKNFSYTKYDNLGRIVEGGEMNAVDGIGSLIGELDDITFPTATAVRILSDRTKTYYDFAAPGAPMAQEYLRNRVSYVEVLDKGAVSTDVTATYYSYDIHGNVKSLLQQITGLPNKRTDYRYDLVSGNVNYVFYQYGASDQFIHRYLYDADNRITDVLTSTDGYIWDKEAKYKYYLHGPLARVELGQYRVQGLDYYYTLQGWVKGVNMPYAADPGNDGNAGTNLRVGRDVFAYTLGYFENDYKPATATVVLADTRDQLWQRSKDVMGNVNTSLYNGNISWMITDLKKIGQQKASRVKGMQAMVYRYDQLNRIIMNRSLTVYAGPTGFATRTSASTAAYDENFSYDANGNIKTLTRRDNAATVVDNFVYTNYTGTNKLRYYKTMENMVYNGVIPTTDKVYQNVIIGASATVPAGQNVTVRAIDNIDIDLGFAVSASGKSLHAYVLPETEGVFNYDAIGNLIWDQDQKVKITWTPYGKVRQVTKEDGTVTSFRYDGAGSRIEKKTVLAGVTTITRYVHDASGNIMGVYEGVTGTTLTEQSIYGSARLGIYSGGRLKGTRKLGTKNFELSNHLGNVLTVITDNIRMTADSTWATVVSANDYYAFGSTMVGRNFNDNTYRYGFNGKEKDEKRELGDTHYDYGFRIYNPRLGRFLSMDPLTKSYPMLTPYQFASNTPIWAIDVDGLEAATTNAGVETMVIVVQGANENYPPNGKTQVQNDPNSKTGIEYDGISRIHEIAKDNPKIQVVVFSSSQSENTKDDIVTTIKGFKKANPRGQLILVGHSLGADNLVELINENKDIVVNHMELLDILDTYDDDDIPANVKSVWNRYVIDNSPMGATMGGEKVEIDDTNKTKGGNIGYTNTSHTTIDQDLSKDVSAEILNHIPPGEKKSSELKTIK